MNQKILALGQWLSTFPYENVTKHDAGEPRGPVRLQNEWKERGAGGTCFSLVNLAVKKARDEYGLSPRYYLGDRPKGEDRHCVIGFPQEGVFLDPGYLCYGPLPLNPEDTYRLQRPQNILQLDPIDPDRLKIQTERKGQLTWRYTLKTDPVTRDRYERAWENSFNWDTFRGSYVMTRQREDDMLLFLNGRLESISREERRRITAPEDTPEHVFLADLFGISPELAERGELTLENE
jgi:hypothetical protein